MNQPLRYVVFAASSLLAAAAFTPSLADPQPTTAESASPPASVAPPPVAPPSSPAAPSADQAAPAPAAGRVSAPPSGKGQVVFFRPAALTGLVLSFSIHEGDKGLAKVGNGTYAIVAMDPGSHTFTTQSEAKDSLTLEVDAGETYYVKQTIGMGLVMARPHLTPSDQASFDKLDSLKPTKATPSGL